MFLSFISKLKLTIYSNTILFDVATNSLGHYQLSHRRRNQRQHCPIKIKIYPSKQRIHFEIPSIPPKSQPSYFKDSFALKDLLLALKLPPTARIFTADAESMYTNIPTEAALAAISVFLIAKRGDNKLTQALISALQLVFRFNFLKFGDTYWQQISGTAMGTPSAPAWAILYYALHENDLVQHWQQNLFFYKRFIDDVIGIWIPNPDPIQDSQLWSDFCKDITVVRALLGNVKPLQKRSTSWTSLSPSSTTKSRLTSMRKSSTCTSTYNRIHPIHVVSSLA